MTSDCKFSTVIGPPPKKGCSLSVYEWGDAKHIMNCSGSEEDKKICPFWSGGKPVVRVQKKIKDRVEMVVDSVEREQSE